MPLASRLFPRRSTNPRRMARHGVLLALGLLAVVFVLAGCDFDDDRRDPIGGGSDNGVRVATFTLNDRDDRGGFLFAKAFLGETDTTVSAVEYEAEFAQLTRDVVDDGLVLLYTSQEFGDPPLPGWTPLPVSYGFDENADNNVDYTITTTYGFDINTLFVYIEASDFITIPGLDFRELEDRIIFRLVTIPGGGFNRGLDYSNYEAVQRAYDLPE